MCELINGRTPEEIKRVLTSVRYDCGDEFCLENPDNCPYEDECVCGTVVAVPKSLVDDTIAYIERLEAAQPKWISVEERLPEADGEHLVLKRHNYRKDDGYMAQEVALFLRTRDPEWVVGNLVEVTHWMPLPEPPEVDA